MTVWLGRDTGGGGEGPAASSGWTSRVGSRLGFLRVADFQAVLEGSLETI